MLTVRAYQRGHLPEMRLLCGAQGCKIGCTLPDKAGEMVKAVVINIELTQTSCEISAGCFVF